MSIRNLVLAGICLLLGSCVSIKDVAYMQESQTNKEYILDKAKHIIKLQAEDQVSIVVNSKDPRLADLFNLPVLSRQIGISRETSLNAYRYNSGLLGFTIDEKGYIDYPIVGAIKVEGMTRIELAQHIKQLLVEKKLLKEATVTVSYLNLGIDILGEVNRPGRYAIEKEHVRLLDALSMAGDMTIYGNRKNVTILREDGSKQISYHVDITSADSLINSPVYYLQQNDVLYVEPNKFRARQSTVNGNTWTSSSFWISLGSLLTTISVLIFK